jgi:hypothetical protein
MEKKWLLRLPKDLDDWLTLRAAEETVLRGKRVSKNTLIIELATRFRKGELEDSSVGKVTSGAWNDVKSALTFIQETIERTAADTPVNDRLRQRISVNVNLLESYIEDMEE